MTFKAIAKAKSNHFALLTLNMDSLFSYPKLVALIKTGITSFLCFFTWWT
jgi:hypothetical protein